MRVQVDEAGHEVRAGEVDDACVGSKVVRVAGGIGSGGCLGNLGDLVVVHCDDAAGTGPHIRRSVEDGRVDEDDIVLRGCHSCSFILPARALALPCVAAPLPHRRVPRGVLA